MKKEKSKGMEKFQKTRHVSKELKPTWYGMKNTMWKAEIAGFSSEMQRKEGGQTWNGEKENHRKRKWLIHKEEQKFQNSDQKLPQS